MKRFLLICFILITAGSLVAQTPTVASLNVTSGSAIKWYSAATGGTLYNGTEALVNGQHYYGSQTVNGVESSTRLDVTATVTVITAAPTAASHVITQTQIDWKWVAVTGATGYKWSATNNYSTATDLGNVLIKSENSLTCGTSYTRYIWAYNTTACGSTAATFTQSTNSCISAPTLTTAAVTNSGNTTATFNGDITAINGANVTTRGFKYSTTDGFNAASAGTDISETGTFTAGTFSLSPSGLTSTTTYYVVAYATNSSGTTYGTQVTFTTTIYTQWTFTNATATAYTGPTQAQVNSSYTSTSLEGGVSVSSGIQYWTVPTTGTYRINALGARGGNVGGFNGGWGAGIGGDFNLIAGDVLRIIVGQTGVGIKDVYGGDGSGGGGGSFVVKSPYNTDGSILVIAGGGGGAESYYNSPSSGGNGNASNDGGTTNQAGCGGTGAGGTLGNGGANGCAAGGGGFFGDGANGSLAAGSGLAFIHGGAGGISTNFLWKDHGGFGGGGAGAPQNGYGGGGGGYSGGGGGGFLSQGQNGLTGNGGGGGSYNSGTNPTNTAGSNNGNGQVIIIKL